MCEGEETKNFISFLAREKAQRIVREHWSSIEAVARELCRKRILYRDQIVDIVRRVGDFSLLGETPPFVERAAQGPRRAESPTIVYDGVGRSVGFIVKQGDRFIGICYGAKGKYRVSSPTLCGAELALRKMIDRCKIRVRIDGVVAA